MALPALSIDVAISFLAGAALPVAWLWQARSRLQGATSRHASSQFRFDQTLDGLGHHIAVLDRSGVIVKVNRAWRDFAASNGVDPNLVSEGAHYVRVCEKAVAMGDQTALDAAHGIEAVLAGERAEFTLEYPCHGNAERRWFRMTVTPIALGQWERHALVSHENITERTLATLDLADRQSTLEAFFTSSEAMMGVVELGRGALHFTHVNQRLREALHFGKGSPKDRVTIEQPADLVQTVESLGARVLKTARSQSIECRFRHGDEETWWLVGLGLIRSAPEGRLAFTAIDLTPGRLAEVKRREIEARTQAMLAALPDTVVLYDLVGECVEVHLPTERNPAIEPEAIVGRSYLEIASADLRGSFQALFEKAKHQPGVHQLEWITQTESGTRTREARMVRCGSEFVLGIVRDVSEQKRAQEELYLAGTAFENIAEGVMVTDRDLVVLSVNKAFTRITGYEKDEAVGKRTVAFASERTDDPLPARIMETVNEVGHWEGELWARRKSGGVYPELVSISAVRNANGEITHYVSVFNDISEHKEYESRLEYLAKHDALTGLPNRNAMSERLKECISRSRRSGTTVAVLFIDLDNFKGINDSLGHSAGDTLLQQVASRLREATRDTDLVARFGGDEFVIVLDGMKSAAKAGSVAKKLREALARPYSLNGGSYFVTASIGISCYPEDSDNVESLLKNADAAMYTAKGDGGDKLRYFSRSLNDRAVEQLVLATELRFALERNEFILHFQPRVDLHSGRITGAEALIRWQHPERGLLSPGVFIGTAEETGLIEGIGIWVLEDACGMAARWHGSGRPFQRIAVNLSPRQFRQEGLSRKIHDILTACGLPPHLLELEITETSMVQSPEAAARILNELKELGVSVAIDDFGTGHSSLGLLKRLPLDYLKIDQSFVNGIPANARDIAIVNAVTAMATSMGISMIGEGVETMDQAIYLRERGCAEAQGYLLGRPMPGPAFEQLLWEEPVVELISSTQLGLKF